MTKKQTKKLTTIKCKESNQANVGNSNNNDDNNSNDDEAETARETYVHDFRVHVHVTSKRRQHCGSVGFAAYFGQRYSGFVFILRGHAQCQTPSQSMTNLWSVNDELVTWPVTTSGSLWRHSASDLCFSVSAWCCWKRETEMKPGKMWLLVLFPSPCCCFLQKVSYLTVSWTNILSCLDSFMHVIIMFIVFILLKQEEEEWYYE